MRTENGSELFAERDVSSCVPGKNSQALQSARRASKAEHLDAAIAAKLGAHHKHPVVAMLGKASEVADQPPLIMLSAATAVAGVVLDRPVLARTGLRMLAAHLVATGIKHVIKQRVDRTRPHKMLAEGRYKLSHQGGDASDEGPWSSFPSGHTAGAVAVARAIARDNAQLAVPAAAFAVGVGLIQVPRRAHFPSDVIAGAVVGIVAEWMVDAVIRRALRGRVQTESSDLTDGA